MAIIMKKRIAAVIAAVITMALIPLIMVTGTEINLNKYFSSNKEIKNKLTEAILAEYREEFSEQGIKALGIVLNSALKAGAELKKSDKNDFIKKYGKTVYSNIERIATSVKDEYITAKSKPLALPYSYLSDAADSKYLKNTCTPWDKLNANFKTAGNGLSLNSVNELCENGLTAEEALMSFLTPKVKIKKQ